MTPADLDTAQLRALTGRRRNDEGVTVHAGLLRAIAAELDRHHADFARWEAMADTATARALFWECRALAPDVSSHGLGNGRRIDGDDTP